jgi:hypothetical protein
LGDVSVGHELQLSDRVNDCSPPTIIFPSWLHAHDVTLVRAPRSFDLTTITCFCLNRSLTSHILSHQQSDRKTSVPSNIPQSRVVGAGQEFLLVRRMPRASVDFRRVAPSQQSVSSRPRYHRRARPSLCVLHISEIDITLLELDSAWSVVRKGAAPVVRRRLTPNRYLHPC